MSAALLMIITRLPHHPGIYYVVNHINMFISNIQINKYEKIKKVELLFNENMFFFYHKLCNFVATICFELVFFLILNELTMFSRYKQFEM